ncbi:MAG: amidohydrolase family protein [Helicobacteraceae bacterium]|jgi:dihydroorotase|nr:amidohydrolase family protein [Helicobacteraceae bacterium]
MLIANAVLTDANGQKQGALRIEDNLIADVGDLDAREGEEILDAAGLWLTPGLIDLNFHLKDPGHKRIETIAESTRSALAGGITTILAAPDTTPPIEDETVAEYILAKATEADAARILFAGEIARQNRLNNIAKLFAAGASAIAGSSALDSNILRRAFEYALMAGKPALISCQNSALAGNGVIHDGEIGSRLGLPAIADYAESSEAARVVEIASAVGCKLVVEAVSAKRSVDLIAALKPANAVLQTLLPHLVLTDEACAGFNVACKLNPPLRSAADRAALIKAVKESGSAIIASGHLPQDMSSRDRPFETASAGLDIAGYFLSLAYTKLVAAGEMTIAEFIRAAALIPARVLGENAGSLTVGARADLILFDPAARREVGSRDGVAKSPWDGEVLFGLVKSAIVGGRLKNLR